ncbi:MAG: lipopolysaccharide assembly protein LapA domain-containing protein [Candidatus Binatia bacterium]
MLRVGKTVFLTLLFILGITFSLENTEPVVLKYYFGLVAPPIPIFLMVLLSVLFGVFIAGIGFLMDQRRLKTTVREKEREIKMLQQEMQHSREQVGEMGKVGR